MAVGRGDATGVAPGVGGVGTAVGATVAAGVDAIVGVGVAGGELTTSATPPSTVVTPPSMSVAWKATCHVPAGTVEAAVQVAARRLPPCRTSGMVIVL
jgi:hypothetical protein